MKDIITWTAGSCGVSGAKGQGLAISQGTAEGYAPAQTAQGHAQYLQELAAEAIGWQPLGGQVYLHLGVPECVEDILVVGVADALMAGENVLLLGF